MLNRPFQLNLSIKLTVDFLSRSLISLGGHFWRVVCPKMDVLSKLSNSSVKPASFGFVNPARKIPVLSISLSVSSIIANVLGMSADSQVLQSVVHRVPIYVINNHSFRNWYFMQAQNNSVNAGIKYLSYNGQAKFLLSDPFGSGLVISATNSGIGKPSVPQKEPKFISEVRSWPFSPSQFSGFPIVGKALAKDFNRWQYTGSIHFDVSKLDVRRIWKPNTSLCAASFKARRLNSQHN